MLSWPYIADGNRETQAVCLDRQAGGILNAVRRESPNFEEATLGRNIENQCGKAKEPPRSTLGWRRNATGFP